MKRLLILLPMLALALAMLGTPSSTQAGHIWSAYPLDASGVSGSVTLTAQADGTVRVSITASGLKSGVQYVSGVYTRSSVACRGGLIRAQTSTGFSDPYTRTDGGVTFTAAGSLSNIWSFSIRETTAGRVPGTPVACGERWPASIRATVKQEGARATVTFTLLNLTSETITIADIRAPIPAGMTLVRSTPTAQLVGTELRWIHTGRDVVVVPTGLPPPDPPFICVAGGEFLGVPPCPPAIPFIEPGETRSFSYILDTGGQGATVRAWATLLSTRSNTSTVSAAAAITAQ